MFPNLNFFYGARSASLDSYPDFIVSDPDSDPTHPTAIVGKKKH
jgi:hypothetical protein